MEKAGVFLARMQPVHNAYLWLVEKALEECDKVYIEKFCPESIINKFEQLQAYYQNVTKNPKEVFSME